MQKRKKWEVQLWVNHQGEGRNKMQLLYTKNRHRGDFRLIEPFTYFSCWNRMLFSFSFFLTVYTKQGPLFDTSQYAAGKKLQSSCWLCSKRATLPQSNKIVVTLMVFYIHYFGIIALFHHTLTSLFNIIYYRFLDLLKTRNILSLRAEQELKMKKNSK